jgi:hypothetical protein
MEDYKLIDVELPLFLFKDEKSHVVYSPTLDLSGYGDTEEEAKKSFQIVMEEFIKYAIEKGTLEDALKKLGWTIIKKKYIPPDFALILQNEHVIRILKEKDVYKHSTHVSVPMVA